MGVRGCIYRIYWESPSYYFYIGQSTNFTARKRVHISWLRLGHHDNERLQRVYNKYGKPFFEILEECSYEDLQSREQYYLDKYFKDPKCCNMLPAAKSSLGYRHSEENKLKFKERMAIPEVREFLSNINKGNKRAVGRKHSPETKIKMGLVQKGRKKTEGQLAAFKIWSAKLTKGKAHPNYGRKFTDEHKANISATKSGKNNPNYGKVTVNAKRVIDISTGETFQSIKKCAAKVSISYSKLKAMLAGEYFNSSNIRLV